MYVARDSSSSPVPVLTSDIDGSISEQERHSVEQMILTEMPLSSTTHPLVQEMVPLSANRLLLMKDVERFELEDPEALAPDHILPQAILLDRYSDFGHGPDTDYDRMYTSLSYAVLRDRNLKLQFENQAELARSHALVNEHTAELAASQRNEIARKRKRVEEAVLARQEKQMRFRPVNEHLELQWRLDVNTMVDAGLEKRGTGAGAEEDDS